MLAVYLVHYQQPDWCRSACESLLGSDLDVKVTVINNGGQVDLPTPVSVVDTATNLGYAGGVNVGLRMWLAGETQYCIVGAHDCHVEPSTLRTLLEAADSQPRFGILAPEPRAAITRSATVRQSGDIDIVDWASGTCLLLRRECIEAAGLFDESFGSYVEDVDLCHRVQAAGWLVGVVRTAPAWGLGSGEPMGPRLYVNTVRELIKRRQRHKAVVFALGLPMLGLRRREAAPLRAVPGAAKLLVRRSKSRMP